MRRRQSGRLVLYSSGSIVQFLPVHEAMRVGGVRSSSAESLRASTRRSRQKAVATLVCYAAREADFEKRGTYPKTHPKAQTWQEGIFARINYTNSH